MYGLNNQIFKDTVFLEKYTKNLIKQRNVPVGPGSRNGKIFGLGPRD